MKKQQLLHKLILLLLIGATLNLFSQVDSLKLRLKLTKTDTGKINIYNALASKLLHENVSEAFSFAFKSISLSKRVNYEKGLAESYFVIGNLHSFNSTDSSSYYLLKAVELKAKLKDIRGVAAIYTSIGTVYDKFGDSQMSLYYYLKSLKLFDSLHVEKGIAGASLGAGNVFIKIKDFKKAIEYYQKSIDNYRKINSPYLSWAINNLANVYDKINDNQKARELYEESLKLKLEANDYYGAVFSIDNIGLILSKQEKYKEALIYFYRALKINREKKLEKETFANSYKNITNVLIAVGNYKDAKLYLDSLEKIINELNMAELKLDLVSLKSEYYEATQDYKHALLYKNKYIILKDSFLTNDMHKQVAEADAKYKTEKKDKENQLLNAQNQLSSETIKQQKIISYFIITGLILALFLAFFIFKGLKNQRKANLIIFEQKIIVEEKHKEITDSINYAERIQRALLASKKMLDDNLGNYFILFKPKDIVSGDFYWATKLNNGSFGLVTADSTGHGVPGAIMSIVNIASLKEAVVQGIQSPDLILNEARRLIIENLKNDGSHDGGKDGMDASLLSFDFENNVLTCACANNPVWIIREKQLIEIKPDRMPIGKHDKDNTPFTLHTIDLQQGDIIYTLTDGFPDQFGGVSGKKFKSKRLQELLMSIVNEPMEAQKQKLSLAFDEWKGDLEQVDDVCIIGIKL